MATALSNYFRCDALSHKSLDDVADFHVAIIGDGNATLHAVAHFAGVVFEAPQRANFALEDNNVISQQPNLGIAFDQAIAYAAAGHCPDFRDAERLQHFGPALIGFLDRRFEQTSHGALDLILQFVNDRVQPDINFLLLRQFLRLTLRTYTEPDNDRVRCRRQQHVAFCNGAHARAQHLQPDLVIRKLPQQIAQNLNRTLHITLQNNVEFFCAGGLQLLGQAFERYAGTLGQGCFTRFLLTIIRNATRFVAIGNHYNLTACLRQPFHAKDFHGSRRRRFFELRPAIIKHGANFSVHIADDEVVASAQRPVLHQYGSNGPASPVQLGFEHHARCWTIGIGLELLQIRNQADHFHQQIKICFLFCGYIDEYGRSAPVFRHQPAIRKLLLNPVRQSIWLVDFVDSDDNWNLSGVRMVDGLQRLRHHTVIRSDHQHNDVRGLRATGTHASECLVAGRIQEHDLAPVSRRLIVQYRHFVCADMLRNSARFASCNIRRADRIQQRGFAMIDVAHDSNHWRTRHTFRRYALFAGRGLDNIFLCLLFKADYVGVCSEESRHLAGKLSVERLIDGGKYAAHEQPRN